MSSFLSTAGLSRASALHPWRVIAAWVLIIVLSGVAASGLGDALTTEIAFVNSPESEQGSNLLEERMHGPLPLTETIVIRSETLTVDDPAFQQVVEQTTADVSGVTDAVASALNYYQAKAAQSPEAEGLVSPDRHATIIPVTLAGEFEEASKHTDEYLETVKAHDGGEFKVVTVGSISGNEEFNTISEEDLQKAELFGLPAALLVLVIVFGALVAAGVPITLALVSISVAIGLTAVIGRVWDLSFFIVNMITMIGLAVGVDYTLFIVDRYREERRHGRPKIDAISTAGGTASKAVVFSGVTVVLALLGMFLIPTTIFRSLGLGAILVVMVAVVAALTLVPAMLSLLGDRIDWPRRRRYDAAMVEAQQRIDQEVIHRGFWGRVTRIVMGHPVVSLILAIALLGSLAIPYFDMNRGAAGVESLPESDVKTAFVILERDFSAGLLAPVHIVVDAPESPEVQASIDNLVASLEGNSSFVPEAQVQWNDQRDLAEIEIPLAMDANSERAYAMIDTLRNEIIPAAFNGVSADVLVTGDTAFNADFFNLVNDYTPLVFGFVLTLSFLLLLLAFRSIIVPIKAILMNLLSVGAAYGLMVLVFQKGYLHNILGFQQTPTIEAWIPIFLFCVLFGLSMDYHIFLLSRIREHYDQTHRNRESVAAGLQSTARLITGAALIMVVVFAGFAAGRLVMLQQVGFGLAVAVFLDATVIRSVLVPSAMALLGNLNWYLPKWLHWLPDLRVEGGDAHVATPSAATPDLAIDNAD